MWEGRYDCGMILGEELEIFAAGAEAFKPLHTADKNRPHKANAPFH